LCLTPHGILPRVPVCCAPPYPYLRSAIGAVIKNKIDFYDGVHCRFALEGGRHAARRRGLPGRCASGRGLWPLACLLFGEEGDTLYVLYYTTSIYACARVIRPTAHTRRLTPSQLVRLVIVNRVIKAAAARLLCCCGGGGGRERGARPGRGCGAYHHDRLAVRILQCTVYSSGSGVRERA